MLDISLMIKYKMSVDDDLNVCLEYNQIKYILSDLNLPETSFTDPVLAKTSTFSNY